MMAKLCAILNPNHKIEYPDVDWIPNKIIQTIQRCLIYEMKGRPSIDELIKEYEELYY